jgi:predicted TPR repeat methyltransferase
VKLATLAAAAEAEYAQGRLSEAEAICRGLLRDDPDQPEALHLLGRLALQAGDTALAQALIGRAIGRRPNSAAFHRSLGEVLQRTGRFEESLACLERALALEPDSAATYCRAGDAYQEAGRLEEAAACFERAVTLDPSCVRAHLACALALQQLGRLEEAARALRRGLDARPADAEMAFYLAALEGRSWPSRAPEAFIVRHFDRIAPSFDAHLRDRLRYRVPELVAEQLDCVLGGQERSLDVLDAGCGTGLCGPLLRPLARRLVGVDLSTRMLEQAGTRGVYDELRPGELTELLTRERVKYDLIVATDVLIYFGDLEPPFRAAARALRPDGLLAISVERSDHGEYVLHAGARYAHGADYVRRTAAAAGLTEVGSAECELRLELGRPVAGLVGIFRS